MKTHLQGHVAAFDQLYHRYLNLILEFTSECLEDMPAEAFEITPDQHHLETAKIKCEIIMIRAIRECRECRETIRERIIEHRQVDPASVHDENSNSKI